MNNWAQIMLGKRELIPLLFVLHCNMIVLYIVVSVLFLLDVMDRLRSVIVEFPGHLNYFFCGIIILCNLKTVGRHSAKCAIAYSCICKLYRCRMD